MAFYNQGIKPYPFNGIKVQDFGNTPTNKNIARHHGIDGSETYVANKDAILCFASDYDWDGQISQRVVTFKAFLDSYSINYNISKEIDENNETTYIKTYLNKFDLVYNVSINVIAHSVNEAISNMARFAELERILTYPFSAGSNPADPNNYAMPNSYVLFNNLINNGRYWENWNKSFTYNFNNIRKYGLRVSVKNINFSPDLEMGSFEFDNKFYFKAYKITLDLAVPNVPFEDNIYLEGSNGGQKFMTFSSLEKMSSQPTYIFTNNSSTKIKDSGGFPFNIATDLLAENAAIKYTDLNLTLDNTISAYSNNKNISLSIAINDDQILSDTAIAPHINNIRFDCFLESFDYSKEQQLEEGGVTLDINQSPKIFQKGAKITYKFKVNVISANVNDSLRNAAKLSYLFRMININQKANRVLMANLIKKPSSSGASMTYDLNSTIRNGLLLEFNSIGLEIDLEMGFFEFGGFFIPKAYSLTFDAFAKDKSMGRIITTDIEGNNKTIYNSSQNQTDSIYWPFGVKYDNPSE